MEGKLFYTYAKDIKQIKVFWKTIVLDRNVKYLSIPFTTKKIFYYFICICYRKIFLCICLLCVCMHPQNLYCSQSGVERMFSHFFKNVDKYVAKIFDKHSKINTQNNLEWHNYTLGDEYKYLDLVFICFSWLNMIISAYMGWTKNT